MMALYLTLKYAIQIPLTSYFKENPYQTIGHPSYLYECEVMQFIIVYFKIFQVLNCCKYAIEIVNSSDVGYPFGIL